MQRYFLTTEATYETLRQSLNTQLAYPNPLGKSVFQTALYAPRDGFRRVLLAVDTSIPNYAAINTAIAPLLDSDAMEEIDEATYLAAVASATAGASAWDDITGKPSTFAPSAHKTSHATGGSDALSPADIGASAVGHAHTVAQVSGLQTALDAKYQHGNTAAYGGLRGPLMVGTTGRPSYYGTYDQHGNVEEWIQSYGGDGRDNSALFMMRGGSYLSDGFGGSFPITDVWANNPSTSRFENIGFRVATLTDPNGYGGFVDVGDVGNANVQSTSFGGVAYAYKMGRYTVTNEQYCSFLNAVAATDTNALYSASMGSHASGGISRSGSDGSYTYTVLANMGQKPVNFVRWHDAARYCNWLHNGKPTGAQGNATTEDGAYTISSTTTVLLPNSGAKYTLPTESEWIKAGRYKGGSTNAGYWTFATQSDTYPDKIATDLLGSGLPLVALSGSASDLLTGTLNAARLPATAVTAGSYGSASSVATYTVDATGRLTAAGSTNIAVSAGAVSGLAAVATSGTFASLTSKPTTLSGYGITDGVTTADSRLSDARTPTSHSHGNITNAGAIGSTSGLPLITTTGGVITVGAFGTTSGTFCQGNDSRLSDARTPTGAAGGDLTGAYPNPQIAAGAVVTADLADSAVTTAKIADSAVTDAKIASGGLSASSINWVAIQPWAANTAYAKGDLVSNAGIAYRRSAAGTSGATFNTANWQQITPSTFVEAQLPVTITIHPFLLAGM